MPSRAALFWLLAPLPIAVPLATLALAPAPAPPIAPARAGFSDAERVAGDAIVARDVAAHIAFLSDDLLEGRAPGSRGEQLSARYIASVMEALGLVPAARKDGDGAPPSFFQKVPLVSLEPKVDAAVFSRGAEAVKPVVPKELVVMAGQQAERGRIADAELVFVGYGMVAPEYQWDDYKDVDVRGKVVVVMNNDPASDPTLFAGKTRLWYGRWDYKYLQAAKHGAAGAIIIHTTPSAGYPWQVVESSNSAARFELPAGDEPRLVAKMWATEELTRRLAKLGGHDLDALRASAEARGFRPVPLGVRLQLGFATTVKRTEGTNVVGRLPGSDAKLAAETIVYTAHHDHLGMRPNQPGDAIYNGALDNASGVALMLSIAKAAAAMPTKPKRSFVFAALTAEEQGLLGSEFYCKNPTPSGAPGRIAANLNLDSINNRGRTSDFSFIGYGKSSLDGIVEAVARAQGRVVHGDPFPDRGIFYRSDQFNFARVGVPAVYGRGGPTFVGRPPEWGRERQEEYERKHYHQPSDHWDPATWDLAGALDDARLLLVTGLRIANDSELPRWKAGDEFEAARKKALEALR